MKFIAYLIAFIAALAFGDHVTAAGGVALSGCLLDIQVLGSPRALIGTYYQRLTAALANSIVSKLCMAQISDQVSETYKWLGMSPNLREWVGGRQVKGLRDNGFTIKNKTFEATIGVNVDDLRRDKTGQAMVRISELAVRTANHPLSLMTQLVEAGGAATCYDGQYFYDTDHAEGGSGTQSNAITSPAVSTSAPTAVEYENAILASIQQVLGVKDDQGEPMNEDAKSFLVMVPSAHMKSAAAALRNPVLVTAGGAAFTNTLTTLGGFNLELAVNARLTGATKFTVHRMDGQVKPFIHQVELEPQMQFDDESFKENQWNFGVKYIHNVGYGLWQQSCQVTFV